MAGFRNETVYASNVDFTGNAIPSPQVLNDGELLIGNASTPNIRVGTLTSPDSSVTIGYSAPNITLSAGSAVATTYTGDSGTPAVPSAGNLNILGGAGVTTSTSGSTVTINSVVFTDTTAATLESDNGYFATASGAYLLPASPLQGETVIVCCTASSGVVVTANTGQTIRIGTSVSSTAGSITSIAVGDTVTLRYRSTGTVWFATAAQGNWSFA